MSFVGQPRHVSDQVDRPAVADPQARPTAMAEELPLADHLAHRRRVEQLHGLGRPEFARVNRHDSTFP
jgi:hypothetical protein